YPYLAQAAYGLHNTAFGFGAQDVSQHDQGAYTGDVSAAMLADMGCQWVLVGHSERRQHHAETDQQVANKAQAALNARLTPVACVVDIVADKSGGYTSGVVARKLAPVPASGAHAVNQLVLAYVPVWAIGTGKTATPQQAQDVHGAIRAGLDS